MSLALYRTYRPSRLDEVIGQDHVTGPLRRALETDRLHHAFLFAGPRGCGKTSTARILARSMLCERGPTPDPCGKCLFCEGLAPNGPGLVDVIELDAASHGGVDDTRELRERAAFVPAQARFKVYIVDEAHMVSKDGFNALLKLIEEPPDHLKFIFATTEVDKVIPTIRSRTFNYAFRLVPARQLQENLAMICVAESVPYEAGALALIARAAGGSVRDAQSIMGQLIAGATGHGLRTADVAEQLGVTDDALLDAVMTAIAARDGAELFAVVDRVVESGHDIRRFVTDLLHRIRDLLLLNHAGEQATADLLDMAPDRRDALAEQARPFGTAELSWYADAVSQGLTRVKGSTSPRLQLEILAAKLLVPAAGGGESLAARVEALERRLTAVTGAAVIDGVDHNAAATAAAAPPAPAAPASAPVAPASPPVAPALAPETRDATRSLAASGSASAASTWVREPARSGGPPKRPRLSSRRPAEPATTPPIAACVQPTASNEPAPSDRSDTGAESGSDGSGADSLPKVRALWPDLMRRVAAVSRVAAATWEGAEPKAVVDGTLIVNVPTTGQEASIRRSGRDVQLRTLLVEHFSMDLQVRATVDQRSTRTPDPDEAEDSDPLDSDLSGVNLAMRELGATKIKDVDGS